ncbi:hypothetical protein PVAP13_2NG262200 [Panicum virgatum]|uniref:Uncharacterized protein n=1 Tax=Panicum virgatum TaxID=38727 RepID=A0A8T0VIX0_PANVG|nr:hypothetical protein PVAP13_2NG262200 [Panicum virgatum]KAG2633573.1 hypothetical protein PVAP13_2NG262200 [Panicum virgatum]KAG2633574.1 hypothetical protein PVAP13_2NG262200 [Panicum virgatum]KAG2633575.1 hypothetical protein PVAP13_2NG262200 [Panicum virgatum]KAG2633576.1 hypothetical protein PVAP13_2NG262200 [Panicum virgatum]
MRKAAAAQLREEEKQAAAAEHKLDRSGDVPPPPTWTAACSLTASPAASSSTAAAYSEAESWLFPLVMQAASTATAPPPWGSFHLRSNLISRRTLKDPPARPYLTKYSVLGWGTGVDASSISHPWMGPAALDPAT